MQIIYKVKEAASQVMPNLCSVGGENDLTWSGSRCGDMEAGGVGHSSDLGKCPQEFSSVDGSGEGGGSSGDARGNDSGSTGSSRGVLRPPLSTVFEIGSTATVPVDQSQPVAEPRRVDGGWTSLQDGSPSIVLY